MKAESLVVMVTGTLVNRNHHHQEVVQRREQGMVQEEPGHQVVQVHHHNNQHQLDPILDLVLDHEDEDVEDQVQEDQGGLDLRADLVAQLELLADTVQLAAEDMEEADMAVEDMAPVDMEEDGVDSDQVTKEVSWDQEWVVQEPGRAARLPSLTLVVEGWTVHQLVTTNKMWTILQQAVKVDELVNRLGHRAAAREGVLDPVDQDKADFQLSIEEHSTLLQQIEKESFSSKEVTTD